MTSLGSTSSLTGRHSFWKIQHSSLSASECGRLTRRAFVSLQAPNRKPNSGLLVETSNVLNKRLNFFSLQFLFKLRHLFLALRNDLDQCGVGFLLQVRYTEVVSARIFARCCIGAL